MLTLHDLHRWQQLQATIVQITADGSLQTPAKGGSRECSIDYTIDENEDVDGRNSLTSCSSLDRNVPTRGSFDYSLDSGTG